MINRDDLKAFVDGELSPLKMAEIRDEMAKDPTLAREIEEISFLSTSLQSSVPIGEIRGLEETLAALHKRRSPMSAFGWPIAALGVAGVLFALIFPVFGQAKSAAKSSGVAMLEAPSSVAKDFDDKVSAATATPVQEQAKTKALVSGSVHRFQSKSDSSASSVSTPKVVAPVAHSSVPPISDFNGRDKISANFKKDPGGKGESQQRNDPTFYRPFSAVVDTPAVAEAKRENRREPATQVVAGSLALSEDQLKKLDASKPVVLVVDSIDAAKAKLANLVDHFDGTVALGQGGTASNELVVMVPVAKAPEAIDVIRAVVTAPSRQGKPAVLRDEANRIGFARVATDANSQSSADGRIGGGAAGGQGGGGGFGGGGLAGAGGAPGGGGRGGFGSPGGPPSNVTNEKIGGGNRARQSPPTLGTNVGVKTGAPLSGTSSLKAVPAAAAKPVGDVQLKVTKRKVVAGPLRRIVIVLRKRTDKPKP